MAEWVSSGLRMAPDARAPKRRVVTTAGQATAILRRCWAIGAKDRAADVSHNAADAAVVAACTIDTVRRVSAVHASKRNVAEEEYKKALAGSEPWPGFARDVLAASKAAVPSRMGNRSTTGRLFEETNYRLDGYTDKGLAMLSTGFGASRKAKPSGNFVEMPGGWYSKPDGQAFLQLWWDPEGKARGRKEPGCWLADVVFYSDIKAIEKGEYVPKYARRGIPRTEWEPVPARAMARPPLRIHRGDTLKVNGEMRLYSGFGISSNNWRLAYVDRDFTDQDLKYEATKGLALSQCGLEGVSVIEIGPLGMPAGN